MRKWFSANLHPKVVNKMREMEECSSTSDKNYGQARPYCLAGGKQSVESVMHRPQCDKNVG